MKIRNCLKCNQEFESKSNANRLCSTCNSRNRNLSAQETAAHNTRAVKKVPEE
jgi:Zn finger protein HypA/HybF involved in hydrogenase expression